MLRGVKSRGKQVHQRQPQRLYAGRVSGFADRARSRARACGSICDPFVRMQTEHPPTSHGSSRTPVCVCLSIDTCTLCAAALDAAPGRRGRQSVLMLQGGEDCALLLYKVGLWQSI